MQSIKAVLIALTFLVLASPARAVTILRDAGIEYSLNQLARPVLAQAGLSPSTIRILVVDDSSLNAFVVDHRHIFINRGLLLKLTTPEMVQAVIAHEAAHIANGHLARRLSNMRVMKTAAGLGVALSAAVAASGNSQAAGGIALGAVSSAQRVFFGHTRAEEASADKSGARYMVGAGIDPTGAVDVFDIFRGQEALPETRQDPYARTHPLSRDRLREMKAFAGAFGGKQDTDNAARYWHARAIGKLSAFSRAPKWTLRRANDSISKDIRLMREAVAYHRQSNLKSALNAIDGAIALRPKDPYLHDLKGEILLESRQVNAAVTAYGRAVQLAPRDGLIQGGYGRALLAAGRVNEARQALEAARGRDRNNASVLRDLAVAYAKSGQNGMASLVTAERYALMGRMKDANIHATRAEGLLPRGSGPWQRAQDVLSAAKLALR